MSFKSHVDRLAVRCTARVTGVETCYAAAMGCHVKVGPVMQEADFLFHFAIGTRGIPTAFLNHGLKPGLKYCLASTHASPSAWGPFGKSM